MNVEWRDVPSYEGIYQVSNDGRVRTIEGKMTTSILHGERHWHSRILKTKDTWAKKRTVWCGERVTLCKDKQPKEYLVHRLEACAFLGYPLDSELTVNHKDGNRRNNSIDNLEMITRAENIRHGFRTGLYKHTMKPITLVDDNGTEHSFQSSAEATRWLGKSYIPKGDTVKDNHGNVYRIVR
jgi:hypothetical protein